MRNPFKRPKEVAPVRLDAWVIECGHIAAVAPTEEIARAYVARDLDCANAGPLYGVVPVKPFEYGFERDLEGTCRFADGQQVKAWYFNRPVDPPSGGAMPFFPFPWSGGVEPTQAQ